MGILDTGYSLSLVPPNTEVFFAQLMTMWERQILARTIEAQKEHWGIATYFQRELNTSFSKKL